MTVDLKGAGEGTLTLNRHVRDRDCSLTITAIEVSATIAGKTQTLSIASVTCGKDAGQPGTPPSPGQPGGPPSGSPAPTPSTPTDKAPAPTPVTGDLPVTG